MIVTKLIFDFITGNHYTSNSRQMVDIAAVREFYNRRIITDDVLIDRKYNIADPLTKIAYCPLLDQGMRTGILKHLVRRYILDRKLEFWK